MKPLTLASCLWALLTVVGCERAGPGAATTSGEPVIQPPVRFPPDDPAPPEPPPVPPPEEFAAVVDHPFFPLVPGAAWSYLGQEDGLERREEVRVSETPQVILGVACTPVTEQVFLDGDLAEMTTHWYAQDADGNVWKFGEESLEFGEGIPVATGDSWEAGIEGALPWIVLGADPQPGDVYVGHRPDGGIDESTVLALGVSESVPAGTFEGCMEMRESNPDDPEDTDRIIYAPGVGLVSEQSASGEIDLVQYGR